MRDGQVLFGIEDERITRRKHGLTWWYERPCIPSVDYCLNAAGLTFDDVDFVVAGDLMPARLNDVFDDIIYVNHHLLHAASIHYLTAPNEMAVLVADGGGAYLNRGHVGEDEYRETVSFFRAHGADISLLGRTIGACRRESDSFSRPIRNSLGYFYDLITRLIGFEKYAEGKTMGLAAYGRPIYAPLLREFVQFGETMDSAIRFDPLDSGLYEQLQEIIRARGDDLNVRADIAASGQQLFEEGMIRAADLLIDATGLHTLGVAGGCALNAVANSAIASHLRRRGCRMLVLPFANDAGQAYGAAAWQSVRLGEPPPFRRQDAADHVSLAYGGRSYADNEVLQALLARCPSIEFVKAPDPAHTLAARLAEGNVIAYFHGGAEFGPRALGHRSILASPASAKTRDRINRQIKQREPYRPIAPMVPDERFSDYFHGDSDERFMITVSTVRSERMYEIPAVVHVDGTARVQSVRAQDNPEIHRLLMAMEHITGCPVLCNTSFNGPSEPIVETPAQAIDDFLRLGLDYLFLSGFLVWRPTAKSRKT
jgi:carbamoyltransferase